MSNLLSVVRISDLTDATTSPERQKAKNQQYADLGDHKIIATAEDLDVSGKIGPFERKSLGPWLTDPAKISQWDALIVSKLDRLSRSVRDFCELVEWLTDHGKKLVCLDPSIDLTSPRGEFMAQMIVGLAQFERKITSVRVKESTKHQRAQGQYVGGQIPFGYMPVKLDGKGWGFVHDPVYAPIVAEMTRKLLGGWSQHQIAIWLNETGVPTSRNVVRRRQGKPELPSEWKSTSISKILGSPNIIGVMTSNGDVLRGADGIAVKRAEPLIDRETFELIKERLQQNSARTGPRSNGAALLRVAFCGACGSVMHISKAGPYRYYACANARKGDGCAEKRIRTELVEDMLEQALLDAVGNDKTRTRRVIAATDNTAEIAKIEEAIENLTATYASAGMSAERYAKTVATLESRQAKLVAEDEEKKQRPAEPEWVEGSDTVSEHWTTVVDRNAYLRNASIRIYVRHHKVEDPNLTFEHDLLWDAPRGAAKMPDDEHVSTFLLWKDGVMGELFLGDLSRAALRAA
jgi:site-specific DNA recombinase